MRPAGLLGDPEDVFADILVAVLGAGRVIAQQGLVPGLEGQGDVAQEDETEDDVLVVRGLQVLAQLVGSGKKIALQGQLAFRGGVLRRCGGFARFARPASCHGIQVSGCTDLHLLVTAWGGDCKTGGAGRGVQAMTVSVRH